MAAFESLAGLLDLPLRLIEQGNFNRVPMVLGTNANVSEEGEERATLAFRHRHGGNR